MASAASSITADNLEARLKGFQQIVEQGASGAPSDQYIASVETALTQITTAQNSDTLAANAVWKKGGLFGLGGEYRDANNNVVSTPRFKAAKKLAPADNMIRATLQGLLERSGKTANRQLGQRVDQWSAQLSAAEAKATSALASLKAGKAGAGQDLAASIGEIRDIMKRAAADADKDTQVIAGMSQQVESFAPVANDTGIFSRRPTEKASLDQARAVNTSLAAEPQQERAMSQSGAQRVRPFVVGRLESDSAMADRGYPLTVTRNAAWQSLIAPTSKTQSAASGLASGISTYDAALTTVAQGPARIAQLDANLAQARANYEQATRDLQQARAVFVSNDRSLSTQRAIAEATFAVAVANLRSAQASSDEAEGNRDRRVSDLRSLDSRIASLEARVTQLQNENSNKLPGSGGSNNGGNRLPGNGGGNSLPGGGTTNNSAELREARDQLATARGNRSSYASAASRAQAVYEGEFSNLQRARSVYSTTQAAVVVISNEQNANQGRFNDVERFTAARGQEYNNAQGARTQAGQEIDGANSTIDGASDALSKAATAYNQALAAELAAEQKADIGDDGHKAMRAIPASSVPTQAIAQAVNGGGNSIGSLRDLSKAITTSANQRAAAANGTQQKFAQQGESIISTAVSESLR